MIALPKRFDPLKQPEPDIRVLPDPPPTPPPVSNPSAPITRISFGAVPVKKKRDSKEYPVLADATEEVRALAAQIAEDQRAFDALEGALKSNKAEIRNLTRKDYYENLDGAAVGEKDANGLRIFAKVDNGIGSGGVLILATSKYPIIADESALVPLLGDRVAEFFKQSFEIKLKSDNLPEEPEKQQAFVNALIALLEEHKCAAALEVAQGVKATKEFHSQRHKILNVAQNLEMDALCPFVAQIKSKGIK